MSEPNGKGSLLSLETARASRPRKGNDLITVQQAYDMVIQECAKVHEHYLTQLPHFTARMIQDALLSYGLIVPQPGVDIAPAGDSIPTVESADAIPPSGDTDSGVTIPTVAEP